MLTMFQIEKHFNKLHVRLHVETKDRDTLASITITYDRRIVLMSDIRPADVDRVTTPAKAEAWLGETVTLHGSRVETWEHDYRRDLVSA